ncbi:inner membrane protein YjdF [Neisseria bacilliformis ATCC BAA-1200]|uniref:Inner membrane protein YjdF n=2 Tax=Neisseria TaxID=482 RepID=F2BE06_9NEIS|nr:inner membrane protein YjdF [Neisseria bacilliformis ATCC BAA-1200]
MQAGTASNREFEVKNMNKQSIAFPAALALMIGALIVWSGISPHDRAVWYAEIVPVAAVWFVLTATAGRFRFSNTAYFLMSLWLAMHSVGAHYTFAEVPFDWANRLLAPLLGEGRNHFDRVGHYIIGFYAFPMAEWLTRRRLAGLGVAVFFALFFIMAVAAAYEIIEWQYAVIDGGSAGIEFLGSQGDVWDAQKDMLADTLGALTSLALFLVLRPDKRAGQGT